MKMMKINLIFLFLLLIWIDSAISRSPVKKARPAANTKKVTLDLSSGNGDVTQMISQAFVSAITEFKSQLQQNLPVTISFFVTPPPNTKQKYVANTEVVLRNLIAQWVQFPMQGYLKTEVKGKDDGTVGNMTITVSILPPVATKETRPPNFGSVNVDLSKPNVDMMRELRQVLAISLHMPSVRDDGDSSNRIKLQIIAPKQTTSTNVHDIVGAVQSVLSSLLPETQFSLKISVSQYPDGSINYIYCIISIDKSPIQRKNSFTYSLDISETIEVLDGEISNILQDLQPEAERIFSENRPVFISLKVKPPPGSNKQTITQIMDSVSSTINRYFSNKVDMKAQIQENSRKEITSATLDITIEPSNTISINLNVPGGNLDDQITREVTNLKDVLKSKKPIAKTTSFTVIIKPPTTADDKTVEKILHAIGSTFSEIFPGNELKIQIKTTKNSQGVPIKITIIITVEQNAVVPTKNEKVEHIDLSKPGSDLINEIRTISTNLKNTVNKYNTTPLKLTLDITPPDKSKDEFITETMKTILAVVTEDFPEDKIKCEANAQKTSQGNLINVKIIITIIPSTSLEEPEDHKPPTIDLTTTESDMVTKTMNILPKLSELMKDNQPASIRLKIQPTGNVKNEAVKQMVNTIVSIFSQAYPQNKLEVQVKLTKDSQGNIENITVFITIEPTNKKPDQETTDTDAININLDDPKKKLVDEISVIIPTLKPKIEEKQKQGIPFNINVNIKPPRGATTEYVKKSANTALTIISKLLPGSEVGVTAKITKNGTGKITDIKLIVTIKPKKTNETTPKPDTSREITLDLFRPGKDVTKEISTSLVNIKKQIDPTRQKNKPVDFQLNIKPPSGSDDSFVRKTVNIISTLLPKLYPDDKIALNVNILKNTDQTIKNVRVSITVSPQEPETISTPPTPKNVHKVQLDLSKPGTDITKEITTQLIKAKPEVIKKTPYNQPGILQLDIEPPKDASDKFAKNTVNIVTTFISKLFPDKKIVVKVQALKTPDGTITKMILVINIEPPTNRDETTTSTSRTTTTTTDIVTTPLDKNTIKFNIDLSNPNTDLTNEVMMKLPDIKDEVLLKQPKNIPVKIEFDINVPVNPSEDIVKKTPKTIEDTLKRFYPDNELVIRVKLLKDRNGTISNMVVVCTIKPATKKVLPFVIGVVTLKPTTEEEINSEATTPSVLTTPSEEEPIKVDFDLTKPTSNLVSDILTVIPNIKKEVDNKRPAKKPVNIEFQVKPSKNTNEKTLKKDMKDIMEVLTKKFPNEEIKINTKIHKQNNKIDNVTYFITIEPSSTTDEKEPKESSTTPKDETTTEVTSETTTQNVLTTPSEEEPIKVDFDLTKPTSNLVSDILTVIPNIEKEVDNKRPTKKPVNIEFQVKPSKNTNEKTLKKDMKDIMEVLTKKFPNEQIKINTKIQKRKNKIDNVTYFITIEPSSTTDEKEPKESLTTPKEETTTEVTSGTTTQNVLTTPSEEEPIKVDFDLTKPTSNLVSDILTVIPNIEKEVDNKRPAKKPVNIEFQVKPSKNTNEKTLKKDMKDIMEVLTKKFPNDEVKINTKIHKKNNKIENVTYFITIEPSSTTATKEVLPFVIGVVTLKPTTENEINSEATTPSVLTTPSEEEPIKVDFDLTKPSTNLVSDILTVIPNIEKEVDNKRPTKKPVNIEFQVKPSKNTNEKTLKKDMKDIMEVLTKKFPNEEIKINTKIHKQNNKIDNVTYFITIEPSSTTDEKEPKESSTTPKEETTTEVTSETTTQNVLTTPSEEEPIKVDFDLTKPSTDLVSDILTIIPDIEKEVDNKRPAKKPVNIEFQVKPSKNTNEKTLKKDMKDIMEVLTKKFPNDEVKINTKIHKQNNKIDNVTYFITIEPSSTTDEKEPKESSTTPKDEMQDFDKSEKIVQEPSTTYPTSVKDLFTTEHERPEQTLDDIDKSTTTPREEISVSFEDDTFKESTTSEKESTTGGTSGKVPETTLPTENTSEITETTQGEMHTETTTPSSLLTDIMNKFTTPGILKWITGSKETGEVTTTPATSEEGKTEMPTGENENIEKLSKTTTTPSTLDKILGKVTIPEGKKSSQTESSTQTEPSTTSSSALKNLLRNFTIPKWITDIPRPSTPKNIFDDFTTSRDQVTTQKEGKVEQEITTQRETTTTSPRTNDKFFTVPDFISKWFTDKTKQTESSTVPKETGYELGTTTSKDETPFEETTAPVRVTTGRDKVINVGMDLSRPGTNFEDNIEGIIPNIAPTITSVLKESHPVTLTFEIKPPTGSDPSYIDVTTQSLLSILTKHFPNDKINIKTKAQKDPEGYVTQIVIQIVIEPSKPQRPGDNNVDIDISKPGSSLSDEVSYILPNILPKVTTSLNNNNPATLTFTIKPPTQTTENDLQIMIEPLQEVIRKYLPENEVKIKLNANKNPQGYISQITVDLTIVPAPKDTTGDDDIDLTKPGTTLVTEFNKLFPNMLPNITKTLEDNKPISITLKVKPSTGMTESYLPVIISTLESILTQDFPRNKITVDVNSEKDTRNYLKEIIINIRIEPSPTEKGKNLIIDLGKPGTTLVNEVREVIPTILTDVTEKLSNKQPVTLNFKIRPPTGTTESYLQNIPSTLETILSQYFPNNKISFKISASKDTQGYITVIIVDITVDPSESRNPTEKKVDIDLTKPGRTLTDQINDQMPSIMNDITDQLKANRPTTLTFKIKPPRGSTESYLQELANSVVTILTSYFPDNEITVKLNAEKDSRGYISDVTLEITLKPSMTPAGDDKVDIDLTKPGTTLIKQIQEKMPNILGHITNKLKAQHPVTVTFKVKPPSGSTESYLQELTNSVTTILTKYFPNNKISLKMNADKNSRGYITEVTLEITLNPSLIPQDDDVDIDLTKPGTTLIEQFKEKMPDIMKNVKESMKTKRPVTLSFNIKPPSGSTESYLDELTNSVMTIMSKYFPANEISVKVNTQKDPRGFITVVTLEITLQPSTAPYSGDVDIDLSKPGVTLTNQIGIIMPSMLPHITKDLANNKPVTLSFKIKPPPRSTQNYLQVVSTTLESLFGQYLPNNEISIKLNAQQNSQNYFTLINIQITIQPSDSQIPQKRNIEIDLTNPNVDFNNELSGHLTAISPQVTSNLGSGKPVNITIGVKPPHRSTEDFIHKIIQPLESLLKKIFPSYKINIETSAEKNSQGYISDILFVIVIQPAEQPKGYSVDINLSNSRYTLMEQIYNIIPNILPTIQDDLSSGESITLSFKVLPPNRSGQGYLKTLTDSLVPILSKFFPENEMGIKTSAQKNSQGYLVNIIVDITIKSNVQLSKVDIDLSIPGSTLRREVSNVLPQIAPHLKGDLKRGKPVTLRFNIRAPMNSGKSYQNQVTNELVSILPKYFPYNRMGVKTSSSMDAQGFISVIVVNISIQP